MSADRPTPAAIEAALRALRDAMAAEHRAGAKAAWPMFRPLFRRARAEAAVEHFNRAHGLSAVIAWVEGMRDG